MIEARGLTRRFGDFLAADSVTFSVPDGAILALLGPNGAGKTTTVRMLAGLLAPSAGDAIVAGFDVRREPTAVRTVVGLVTDVPGLYEQMPLPAYLDFFGALYGMASAARTKRIDELLDFFDLSEHRRERMAGFSKGMKQKVALARALLHEPKALYLDEPTSGLDPIAARAVRDLIVSLKQRDRSIILCTHDLDEAERLADQVAILRAGRIVALDAPASLRSRSTTDTTVRIELAAPAPNAVAEASALTGISHVPQSSASDTAFVYQTPEPTRVNPQVIERLVMSGARVVSVTCETRTLEDVYAEAITGRAAMDGATAGAMDGEDEVAHRLPVATREK